MDSTLLGDVDVRENQSEERPCCDRSILIGNVFKIPEKKINLFDLVQEAKEYHSIKEQN